MDGFFVMKPNCDDYVAESIIKQEYVIKDESIPSKALPHFTNIVHDYVISV